MIGIYDVHLFRLSVVAVEQAHAVQLRLGRKMHALDIHYAQDGLTAPATSGA
jgi:hypothetical protein